MAVLYGPPPYISLYKRTGTDGTFVKLAQPSAIPTGAPSGASFTNDGEYLAVSHPAFPYLTLYKRDGDTFNQIHNPAEMPTAGPAGVSLTADGKFMSVIYGGVPFINFYRRTGDTFVKEQNLLSPPSGAATTFALSRDGSHVGLANAPPPYMASYSAVPPFDIETHFMLPRPTSLNSSASPLGVTTYIKAKP
tara:strand:- start:16 stop:591 length:576 start_codon:yes stop_codon:yes gene_type:complete